MGGLLGLSSVAYPLYAALGQTVAIHPVCSNLGLLVE